MLNCDLPIGWSCLVSMCFWLGRCLVNLIDSRVCEILQLCLHHGVGLASEATANHVCHVPLIPQQASWEEVNVIITDRPWKTLYKTSVARLLLIRSTKGIDSALLVTKN